MDFFLAVTLAVFTVSSVMGMPSNYSSDNRTLTEDTIHEISRDVIAHNKSLNAAVEESYTELKNLMKAENESLMTVIHIAASEAKTVCKEPSTSTCIANNFHDAQMILDELLTQVLACGDRHITAFGKYRVELAAVAKKAEEVLCSNNPEATAGKQYPDTIWRVIRDFSLKLPLLKYNLEMCIDRYMPSAITAVYDIAEFMVQSC